MLLGIICFSIALSIDSLGVGITYGIRNIKIGIVPRLILFSISFIIVLISTCMGLLAINNLPRNLTNIIGSVLLISMGAWIFYQSLNPNTNMPQNPIASCLKNPAISDFDSSNTIDTHEAVFMGLAISADSLVAGLGISMSNNISWIFPAIVALFQLLFLSFGIYLGKKIKSVSPFSSTTWSRISGSLLILFGIVKLVIN